MGLLRLIGVCVVIATAAAQDEEEGRAVLLLHKKIFPETEFSVNKLINVTLSVFNKGAQSLSQRLHDLAYSAG